MAEWRRKGELIKIKVEGLGKLTINTETEDANYWAQYPYMAEFINQKSETKTENLDEKPKKTKKK